MENWNKFGIACMEDIIKIPDMATAFKIMKDFEINRKGIKTKMEATERIADFWRAHQNQCDEIQIENDFSGILQNDEEIRGLLTKKCKDVETFVNRLSSNHKNDLNNVFPDVISKLRTAQNKLKSTECNILIVGESNSGKSSIVNLILGYDLLPVGCLSTTRNICEIKPSRDQEKVAIIHRKVNRLSRRHAPEILDLTKEEQFQKFQNFISDFDEDTGDTAFDKIEIFWPHRLKQCGLTLIDTPGFGENRSVSALLEQCAAKVSGFIFVLNSSNAGGVQKRVRQLLRAVSSACDQEFSHDAATFVFNKWDTVPEKDKVTLSETTMSQLSKLFPGMQQDHIMNISATEAMEVWKHGDMPEGYRVLYTCVSKIIPICLRNGYNIHYQFLSQVVKRVLYSLKLAKHMDSQGLEEKKKMKEHLKQGIEHLERNTSWAIQNLRLQLKNEARLLYLRVRGVLSSVWLDEEWKRDDCPDVGHWKRVAEDSENKMKLKLQAKLDEWERSEGIGKRIKGKILEQMLQDFEVMEDRMKELEGNLLGGDLRTVNNFHKSIKRPTKSVKDIFAKNRRPSVDKHSLGNVVCHEANFDLSSKSVKSLFRSYKADNSPQKMREAWKRFIETILESDKLEQHINLFLERFESSIQNIEKRIPEILEMDKQLFNNLTSDLSTSRQNMEEIFPQNIAECLHMQGELDMVFTEKLKMEQSDLRTITWQGSDIIGSGSFADVFLSELRNANDQFIKVAVKVYKNPLSVKNVSDILLEERTLRDLNHKNVITYYGSIVKQCTRRGQPVLEWGLVMEYCSRTLSDVLIDGDFCNPCKLSPDDPSLGTSYETIAMYALQICEALTYLHGKSLVHRDLKLANILVTEDNELKLSDVGLTKAETDITTSAVGSPIYMAPEVLKRNVFYDRKADMYSFGILLWEMWYGIEAGDFMKNTLFNSIEDSVAEEGVRPPLNLNYPPPESLVIEIQRCWMNDAEKRPDAADLIPFFQSILNKNQ